MKVELLQKTSKVEGGVGDDVEIDAALGNYLASVGVVVITEHDKPGAGGCELIGEPTDEQDSVFDTE